MSTPAERRPVEAGAPRTSDASGTPRTSTTSRAAGRFTARDGEARAAAEATDGPAPEATDGPAAEATNGTASGSSSGGERIAIRVLAAVTLFTGLAADAWRNSIGWYGYGAVVLALLVASVAVLIRNRRSIRIADVPRPLLAFLLLAALSIVWSAYPGASALGVLAQVITTTAALAVGLTLSREEVLAALGHALRAILALSILFELAVSLLVRAPVLPVWATAEDRADPPVILYWSRNNLLEGERIQGIVGSWSLLGMVAVLGLLVFAAQLASGRVSRGSGIAWVALAAVEIVLTRSATIYLALIAVAVVVGVLVVVRRARRAGRLRLVLGVVAVVLALGAAAGVALRVPLLAALGKSPDLTGRLDIWDAVIGLALQRPVFGWGWVSFWPPWTEPFQNLVRRNGVMQLHAHDAWLDVWLQLGVVGVLVLGALVVVSAVRLWRLADREPVAGDGLVRAPAGDRALRALPLLVLVALLVQSLAESRLLVEGGWLLLVLLAVIGVRARRGEGIGTDRPAA